MDQIAQLNHRQESFHLTNEKEVEVPLRARLHVFLDSLREVTPYNASHVVEQATLFFSLSCFMGMLLRSSFMSSSDPVVWAIFPFVTLVIIWILQEQIALKIYRRHDPLTKVVKWQTIIRKYFVKQQKSSDAKELLTEVAAPVSVEERDDGYALEEDVSDDASKTNIRLQIAGPPTVYPKREFTPAQEDAISVIKSKYFLPTLEIWTQSQFLCVNDDGRWAAIRALDARKWKVDQACALIENNIKWREKENVDNILNKVIPPEDVKRVRLAMSDGFFGLDRVGSPIYWCPAGQINLTTLKKEVPLENIVNVHLQLLEYNHRVYFKELSQSQNRCIYQSTCVLDLKGFCPKHVNEGFWQVMQAVMTIDRDYYYENVYRVYILNAPGFFRFFWKSIVAPLMTQDTREKFRFLANPKELHQYIDPSTIPKLFGGAYEADDALYSETSTAQHCSKLDAYLKGLQGNMMHNQVIPGARKE